MKPVHQGLFAIGLLLLGAVTWWVLTRPKPQAAWLRVEAPARVAPGETMTLRVTLTAPAANLQLLADLHGWTRRNHPLRAISRTAPQPAGPPARALDFHLTVPELPDLAAVRAIIYLSPTGSWADHITVVISDPIPVETATGSTGPRKLQSLSAHDQVPDPVIPRVESPVLRHLIFSLWLVAALGLGLLRRRAGSAAATSPRPPPSVPLIAACVGAALAELFRIEVWVGDVARRFALRHGLYDERLLPQQVAVLLTVVGLVACAGVILGRARRRRLVLGLLLHAAIALVAILSLHEADAALYATCLGLPLEQLAKVVAVALALSGLRGALSAPVTRAA